MLFLMFTTMTLMLHLQIIPLIDGANYTRRIADRADVDLELVRKAIQHLLYK